LKLYRPTPDISLVNQNRESFEDLKSSQFHENHPDYRRHSEQVSGKDISFRLIHTGQHNDNNTSDSFFEQLGIPMPDVNLGPGGGTQAEQTAAIMVGYEKLLLENGKPAVCLVVGDVTSTMACSITAQKMHVDVVHVEAGKRSGVSQRATTWLT
jgi:UDP-N-acetylglucosamine 2-epimerase